MISLVTMGLRGSTLVIKFIFTLFIARFMGLETLGLYGLITASTILALVFLGFGLTHTLTRKAVTQSPEEITRELWYYGRFTALIYVFVSLVAVAVGVIWDQLLLVFLITLLSLLEHMNNNFYVLLLNRSRILSGNMLHFIRSGAWMCVFMAVSFLWPSWLSMEVLLSGWIIGNVLAVAGFIWLTRSWPWSFSFSGEPLMSWFVKEFAYSKVVYAEGMARSASTYVDRYIILLFLGLELTGVYVFFWSISSALSNLIATGVIQFSRPKMVQAFKDNNPAYKNIFKSCLKQTTVISLCMGLIVGGLMYFVLPHINRPLIWEWYPVLWLVIVGFVFSMVSQVQNLVFYSQHRDDLTLKTYLIVLVGAVGFNFALIPILGIWGAGISVICVALLSIIIQHIYIKRLFAVQEF